MLERVPPQEASDRYGGILRGAAYAGGACLRKRVETLVASDQSPGKSKDIVPFSRGTHPNKANAVAGCEDEQRS